MTRYLSGLSARFDAQALQPPAPGPGASGAAGPLPPPGLAPLLAWCHQDAGPGGVPWWQPGAAPRIGQRLAVATLSAPGVAAEALATADALARWLAWQIDGSLRLQALPGRAAGLAWRLQVKLADAAWWRARQTGDPWDAGWARASPAAAQHLAQRFEPRRATLVLAEAAQAAVLAPALRALQARSGGLQHPVRWLWLGTPAVCSGLAADTRFSA